MPLLICYDGSPDSQAAIETAGELFSGHSAVVLTIWEGLTTVLTRAGAGMALAALDFDEIEETNRRAAMSCAEEGCGRARSAGIDAQPLYVEQSATVWETILGEAARLDADVIVLGSRGLTGVKSLLLGSVSHAVLQHADRPVTIVPGTEVARKRSRHRHAQAEPAAAGD